MVAAIFVLSLSPLAMAGFFSSEDIIIQQTETGQIDWVKGVIRSKGAVYETLGDTAKNKAVENMKTLRQAKIEAMRNMIETMKTIRVDSSSTIGQQMEESGYVRKRMHEVVKKAKIVDKSHLSGGGIEIEIELPLKGFLTEIMIQSSSKVDISTGGELLYTGLIIDAGGINLNPALSPKILSDSGKEVFSADIVKRGALIASGLVGYSSDISYAETSSRVADKPLIVRALRRSGANGSDVVISAEDASRIRKLSGNLNWLTECRVILVID